MLVGSGLPQGHVSTPPEDWSYHSQLAFVTTTSDSYRQIKLWTDYHKSIGVGSFYLFVDGQVTRLVISSPVVARACMPLSACV